MYDIFWKVEKAYLLLLDKLHKFHETPPLLYYADVLILLYCNFSLQS